MKVFIFVFKNYLLFFLLILAWIYAIKYINYLFLQSSGLLYLPIPKHAVSLCICKKIKEQIKCKWSGVRVSHGVKVEIFSNLLICE